MQFNTQYSDDNQHEKKLEKARTKRSRRRRNAKSRNKVEPVLANVAKKQHDAPMTKSDLYFSLDCEMVGVGPEGLESAVARVTMVNWENQVVLDTFVQVPVPVTDFRSNISGISAENIHAGRAMTLAEVRSKVENTLRGKILIGHGLDCDLSALGLTHPWCDVRDTATYGPFMREAVDPETGKICLRQRKLRDLAWDFLHRQIQCGGAAHCPVEDAIAALDLYKAVRCEWEEELIKVMQEKEKQRQIMDEQQRLRLKWWFNSPSSAPVMPMADQMFDQQVMMRVLPFQELPQLNASVAPYEMPQAVMSYPPNPSPPHLHRNYVQVADEFNSPLPSTSWFRFVSRRPKSPTRVQQTDFVVPIGADKEEHNIPSEPSDNVSRGPTESSTLNFPRSCSPPSPTSWFRFRRPKSPARQDLIVPQLVESGETAETSDRMIDLVARPRTSTASTAPDDEWLQDMYQLEQELNNLVSI